MGPGDFELFIRKAGDNKQLLARIALNTKFDPATFPVDLSELMSLYAADYACARSFLEACAASPNEYYLSGDRTLEELKIGRAHV